MNYLISVILYIISKFGSERSISGIFHLLTGKKSSQTIQDGRFFNILFLFNTMNHLTRNDINEAVNYLLNHGFIEGITEEHFILSTKGIEYIDKEFKLQQGFPEYLDGWKYHRKASLFWKRYSFMVQCLSNLIQGNHHFLPITRDLEIQRWIKGKIPRDLESRKKLTTAVYMDTMNFLSKLDDTKACYFVQRLSSKEKVGLTHEQCAILINFEENFARMQFQGILHQLLYEMEEDKAKYPALQLFVEDMEEEHTLTTSTRKTYDLLRQGKSLPQISRIRGLKLNTIEDHIVEIAINIPTFTIETFINLEKQRRIKEVIKNTRTKRLKLIKEQLDDEISYFEIRLVFATT